MLLHAWLFAASLGAQGDSGLVFKKPNEIRIPVQRAAKRPAIDGRLDDEVWATGALESWAPRRRSASGATARAYY